MSYEPTIWKKGDKVTSTKLNKIENGIQGNDEEITSIKSGLSSIQTATASDVGKALKAKTVTDGKVTEWEFGEAGGADPEAIEQAVTDWLDKHPEATTTVQDGSITEAKLAATLVPSIKNYYVTPEMFGAVGDGVTDDTQAILNMLVNQPKYIVFSRKNYRVNGSISISYPCHIEFQHTTISLAANGYKRNYEYVLGLVNTNRIIIRGQLTIDVNNSANIGVYISECTNSYIEQVTIQYARIWGLYMTGYNGGTKFGTLEPFNCGRKVHAKAKYLEPNSLELSQISSVALTDDAVIDLFSNVYSQNKYIIDDSGYDAVWNSHSRVVFKSVVAKPIELDENDLSKGKFVTQSSGYLPLPDSSFVDGENPRDVFIPLGGGALINTGVGYIDRFTPQLNPIALMCVGSMYLQRITFASFHGDTIPILIDDLVYDFNITDVYIEGVGNGYTFETRYKDLMCISASTDSRVFFGNVFGGMNPFPFKQHNECYLSLQKNPKISGNTTRVSFYSLLNNSEKLSIERNITVNTSGGQSFSLNIDEYSPREYTLYLGSGIASTINLLKLMIQDTNAVFKPKFAPFHLYLKNAVSGALADRYRTVNITLDTAIINDGYSLYGATNNVLSLNTGDYGNLLEIIVVLFDKTFYVTAKAIEALT